MQHTLPPRHAVARKRNAALWYNFRIHFAFAALCPAGARSAP